MKFIYMICGGILPFLALNIIRIFFSFDFLDTKSDTAGIFSGIYLEIAIIFFSWLGIVAYDHFYPKMLSRKLSWEQRFLMLLSAVLYYLFFVIAGSLLLLGAPLFGAFALVIWAGAFFLLYVVPILAALWYLYCSKDYIKKIIEQFPFFGTKKNLSAYVLLVIVTALLLIEYGLLYSIDTLFGV